MQSMKRRVWKAALWAAGLMFLAGCALLPQEEQLPEAPVIQRGAATEFTMTYVQRGDLIDQRRVNVTYKAVREERLAFALGGVRFDKVFVDKGDAVKKGEMLMELEQEALEDEVSAVKARLETLEMQLEQAEQDRELARARYAVELRYMDEEELDQALTMEEVLRGHERRIQSIEDEITVSKKELGVKTSGIRERQLRAGMDGTVTFLRKVRAGDVTKEGETVAVISDSASSLFVAEAAGMETLEAGLEFEVVMGQVRYPCRVVSARDAGAAKEEGKAYLRADLPTAELTDGDQGYLMLEIDRREDVLYVSDKAVKRMNGREFVYVQAENGLRSTVEVVTGYAAGGNLEVVSGLKEGDAVILK